MNFTLRTRRSISAFTLVELLVSSTIIVVVLMFLITTVDQTRRVINNTTAKVGQFQSARVAFEAMTRNLAQATLNTYYDIDYSGTRPVGYHRQSDLHFVVDKSIGSSGYPKILGSSATDVYNTAPGKDLRFPGHCVFFQAPLGVTAQVGADNKTKKYRALDNLLSVVGYYVEWNEDTMVPEFVKNNPAISKRYRFRLMQVIQPAETNMVYNNTNYTDTNALGFDSSDSDNADPRDWIQAALGQKALPKDSDTGAAPSALDGRTVNSARVLADNVVALIIVPKLSERDRSTANKLNDLTGNGCVYDSRPVPAFANQKRSLASGENTRADFNQALNATQRVQVHQLPPILQVTMVAIDEESAQKLQQQSTTPPDWVGNLFDSFTTETAFTEKLGTSRTIDPNSLAGRLGNTDGSRSTPRMNYRIFTTDVVMRGSKWSKRETTLNSLPS